MFELHLKGGFSAAHRVRLARSKREKLHGHNYRVDIIALSSHAAKYDMVEDFRILQRDIDRVMKKFDHTDLNVSSYLRGRNPTAENIASAIYGLLKRQWRNRKYSLKKVIVWENERHAAAYYE